MMQEHPDVRQIEGDPRRRWFSDDFFDLIVWFAPDGSMHGFQLCYDRDFKPRALTWLKGHGYTHDGIDDGDAPGGMNKSSPILVADGLFDKEDIAAKFETSAAELPDDIRGPVREKIREYKKDL